MPREVARVVYRPIPEWAEAFEVLSRSPATYAGFAFPAIVVVRANDDAIPTEKMDSDEVAAWIRGEAHRG